MGFFTCPPAVFSGCRPLVLQIGSSEVGSLMQRLFLHFVCSATVLLLEH